MNSGRLRYFVTAAEMGSFSAAGTAECVSAQAISKSVSELERDVGVRLFSRTRSGVSLTRFGEAYYRKAVDALSVLADLEGMAKAPAEGAQAAPTVSLAVSSHPFFRGMLVVKDGFRAFSDANPGIDLRLFFAAPSVCRAALEDGSMDAAVLSGRATMEGFEASRLADVAATALVGRGHPAAAKGFVDGRDLASWPVAWPGDCGFLYHRVQDACAALGARPSFVQVPTALERTRAFILQERGIVLAADDPNLDALYPGASLLPVELPAMPLSWVQRPVDPGSPADLLRGYALGAGPALLNVRTRSVSLPGEGPGEGARTAPAHISTES